MSKAGMTLKPPTTATSPKAPSVVSLAAGSPKESPGLAWAAANMQGRLRGIASALDDLANGAGFPEDRDAWLFEVLISALEREADRLEEIETVINNRFRAGAA